MEERNNMYMPYDRRLASLKETDPVIYAWTQPVGNERERKKESSTMKQNLSPDHLTAIYWG
jgi:hypothetical protein